MVADVMVKFEPCEYIHEKDDFSVSDTVLSVS